MRAFIKPARIGIKNKFRIEIWVQNSVNRVVDKPIADACFMDVARFGIANFKSLVITVSIRFQK